MAKDQHQLIQEVYRSFRLKEEETLLSPKACSIPQVQGPCKSAVIKMSSKSPREDATVTEDLLDTSKIQNDVQCRIIWVENDNNLYISKVEKDTLNFKDLMKQIVFKFYGNGSKY